MKIKITFEEIKTYLSAPIYDFPKYSTQILNLANQNSQATRPTVVGKLSDLIKKFPGKHLDEWEEWYIKQYPEAIKIATDKIMGMLQKFKNVLNKLDRKIVENWVRDLVIIKTFIGLRFQEAILKKGAELFKTSYRLASAKEESKGIDGFIGRIPVSIKPDTYKIKKSLREEISVKIIYYKKTKDGIEVDYSELLE
ncbi:MAG: type II restriction endonuclease MjaI [Candidatus Parcubacteria bacterium]|nr:MAG: type II restriction endonuclease MjaI [Candidatus Parcubacteria bacterium]